MKKRKTVKRRMTEKAALAAVYRHYEKGGWPAVHAFLQRVKVRWLCNDCEAPGSVMPDPFEADVNNDDSPTVLCDACAQQSAGDI